MGTKNRRQSHKSSQQKVTLSRLGSRQQWEIFHKSSALSPGPCGGVGRAGQGMTRDSLVEMVTRTRQSLREPCGRDLGLRVKWSLGVQEAPVTLTMQLPGSAGTFSLLVYLSGVKIGAASCMEPSPALVDYTASSGHERLNELALFWRPCLAAGVQRLGRMSSEQGPSQNQRCEDTCS